ncbi:TPA: baseplate protein [Enterobacter hormaechei subsp. xiangfangensis]|nr:baseplate protein [Enterobacter hormaechei subsp. xiangfangensis]
MNFEQLYALFNQMLQSNTWWKRFTNSQFIRMIAVFGAQIIYFAQQYADRALAEGFISTATKRASILAAAEDIGYVGRLILASTGTVTITNKGTQKVSLPLHTPLMSERQLPYVLMEVVDLQPGQTRTGIKVSQRELVTVSTQVQAQAEFYSILLTKELTQETVSLEVYVTANGNKELWKENPQFRLANANSKNYVRFYRPTEQLGIRFGDGTIGMMPPANSQIDINVWTSKGDTTLVVGQRMRMTGMYQSLDNVLSIITDTAITGGAPMESTEETRMRAMYYVAFDDQVVWGADYEKFISDTIADISWINIWGEQQEEAANGIAALKAGHKDGDKIGTGTLKVTGTAPNQTATLFDFNNMNTIFMSAHIPGLTDKQVEDRLLTALANVPNSMNKKFLVKPINPLPYTVEVEGTAFKNFQLQDIEKSVNLLLEQKFGIDSKHTDYGSSTGELYELAQNDIWAEIQKLNMMNKFTVKVIGLTPATKLNDYIYLDVAKSKVTVTYPKVL